MSPPAAPRSSAIRAAATSGAMAPVAVTAIPEVRASVGPASAATGDRAPTSEENAVARVAVMTAAEMIGALHGASRMATWPASSSAWERTKGCDRATWWVLSPTRHVDGPDIGKINVAPNFTIVEVPDRNAREVITAPGHHHQGRDPDGALRQGGLR